MVGAALEVRLDSVGYSAIERLIMHVGFIPRSYGVRFSYRILSHHGFKIEIVK